MSTLPIPLLCSWSDHILTLRGHFALVCGPWVNPRHRRRPRALVAALANCGTIGAELFSVGAKSTLIPPLSRGLYHFPFIVALLARCLPIFSLPWLPVIVSFFCGGMGGWISSWGGLVWLSGGVLCYRSRKRNLTSLQTCPCSPHGRWPSLNTKTKLGVELPCSSIRWKPLVVYHFCHLCTYIIPSWGNLWKLSAPF